MDYADTQLHSRAEFFDIPRFRRTVYTVGAAYTLEGVALAKLAFSHRRLGASTFRLENTLLVSTGFSY